MQFTITQDGWIDDTGTYLITRDDNPWWHPNLGEEAQETWLVQVRKWSEAWAFLYRAADFDGAKYLAEQDATRPVFDDAGCRWCGTQENYLKDVPTGWFGCRLCDPTPETESHDLTWEDVEAYDDPA